MMLWLISSPVSCPSLRLQVIKFILAHERRLEKMTGIRLLKTSPWPTNVVHLKQRQQDYNRKAMQSIDRLLQVVCTSHQRGSDSNMIYLAATNL